MRYVRAYDHVRHLLFSFTYILIRTEYFFLYYIAKQVGLAPDHSYARSLARFGTGLGPTAWKIVSEKISSVLPPGVEFGPGWVGESKMPSIQSNSVSQGSFQSEPPHQLTSGLLSSSFIAKPSTPTEEFAECWGMNSMKGGNDDRVVGSNPLLQIPHHNAIHSHMNGFGGSFASESQFQEPMARRNSSSMFNNHHALDSSSAFDASRSFHGGMNYENEHLNPMSYWQNLSTQERGNHPYLVELNRGFQTSGPITSNFPIGSPQLDLAL